MYKNKKIAVIIAAGGMGSRMNSKTPKQFLKLDGVPILSKTVSVFCQNPFVDDIIIVTNKDYIRTTEKMFGLKNSCAISCKEREVHVEGDCAYANGFGSEFEARASLFTDNRFDKIRAITTGGETRQDSISNGLRCLSKEVPDYDYVMIHDGARPYVTNEVIEDALRKALNVGASIAAMTVKDTIRQRDLTLERKELYIVQTPQTFEREIIEKAYERAYSDGYFGTDDGSLVERLGRPVAISKGDYKNIKITTEDDLPMERRVGTGFDVHELVAGRELILGGEKIDFEKGLLGHSDADVLLHAIMDALLGAAALGDIGRHFPDTDERYKGISSLSLLAHVGDILKDHGYRICNIDATLMAQRPKILPYIDKIKNNIARTLGIDVEKINIKGTTTEKLGFVGREEGMAAQAICMIEGEIKK